jgi:hypothetical protein
LSVLAKRSIALTPDAAKRSEEDSEVSQLDRWHDVAVTAKNLLDVFTDG